MPCPGSQPRCVCDWALFSLASALSFRIHSVRPAYWNIELNNNLDKLVSIQQQMDKDEDDDFVELPVEPIIIKQSSSGKVRPQTGYQMASNFLTNSMYMFNGLTNPFKGESHEYVIFGQRLTNKVDCTRKIKQTVWITYRKDFPQLIESKHISDTGWGCMIRVGQMLLASALKKYQSTHYGVNQADIVTILSSFLDDDENKGSSMNYSIQKIVKIGYSEFKLEPGTWLTPSHISYILEQLHNNNPLRGYQNLRILVFNNNTLFYEQILNQLGYAVCKCPKTQIKCKMCHAKKVQNPTSVLVILLSRIGLDVPHNQYREVVMDMLELKQFVGMIGGKPKRALFFLGHQGRKELIYLDPHYVQNSVNRKNLESAYNTFFCDSYRSVDYKAMDPSLGFGFLIKDLNDLQDFYANMCTIYSAHKEQFFVYTEIKTPDYVMKELRQELKQSNNRMGKLKQMFKDSSSGSFVL